MEHLPCLFNEVTVKNRCALRFAVLAAANASFRDDSDSDASRILALHYYGLALSALSKSLAESKNSPDDYILMTVVVLDLFEVSSVAIFPSVSLVSNYHA